MALLEEQAGGDVYAIDGARANGTAWWLAPGGYELILKLRYITHAPNVYYEIVSYCEVRLEAAAGGVYRPSVRARKKHIRTQIELGVEDGSGQLVARAHSCRKARPVLE